MTAVLVQKTPNTTLPAEGNNVSSMTVTFNTKPTAGNFVAVLWALSSNVAPTFSSLTDNQGNTYTAGKSNTDAGGSIAAVYYTLNILTGSPFTVTLTFSGVGFFDFGAVEFQGVDTTGSPVATSGNSGTSGSISTGAIVAPKSSLYLGVFGTDNTDATGALVVNGQQLWLEPSSTVEAAGMSYIAGQIGSQTITWSSTASPSWSAAGAAFGEVIVGPATFPNTPTSKKLAATVWQGV